MIISFEGIDGSGKSTQIDNLKDYFDSQSVSYVVYREPGATKLGEYVRGLLLNPDLEMSDLSELLLFYSSRAQLIEEKIRPAVSENKVVILDRFFDSTFAYQGYGRGIVSIEKLEFLNDLITSGLVPDFTFYLRLSYQESVKRLIDGNPDRMEKNGSTFFERVISGYDTLAQKGGRWKVIDASLPVGEIFEQIVKVVQKIAK